MAAFGRDRQNSLIRQERRKAAGRRLARTKSRTATEAEKQEIADYLAREPVPRSYV